MYDDDTDRERNKSNSSNGRQPSFEASDSEQMSSSDTTNRFNFGAQANDSNARSSRTFSKQPRTSTPSTSKRRQKSPAGSQSKRTNRGRGQRDRTDSLSDSLAGKRENECRLTGHSAYVATATESDGAKIDGLLPPNFL